MKKTCPHCKQRVSERAARYSWYVLAILLCVYSANWMDRYVLIILLQPIKHDLKLSDTALGLLSGFAFAAVYSFAGIPIARWADRAVRRTLIAGGLVVWSAMTGMSGLAVNLAQLVAARFGVALGESACSPAASSLIADYFPAERRATAFAIYGVGIPIGMALGLAAGGWANQLYGWRTAFFVVGVPGLVLALILRLTVREPIRGQTETVLVDRARYSSVAEAVRAILVRKSFLAYGIGLGLFSFSSDAFETWTPVYLMRAYHLGTGALGTLIGTIDGVSGLIGTLAGGVIADRLGRRDPRWYLWLPAAAAGAMIPFMYGFLHTTGGAMYTFYFLTEICSSSYMAPIVAITQRVMPVHLRALSTALLYLLLNLIGPGAGPFVTGVLSDLFTPTHGIQGLRLALIVTLLGAACGVALTLWSAGKLPEDLARGELGHCARI